MSEVTPTGIPAQQKCEGCGCIVNLTKSEGWTAEEAPAVVFCKRSCLRDWRLRLSHVPETFTVGNRVFDQQSSADPCALEYRERRLLDGGVDYTPEERALHRQSDQIRDIRLGRRSMFG